MSTVETRAKSAQLDRNVIEALVPIVPSRGGIWLEIELRAVNYLVASRKSLFAHRVELAADAPDNTLAGGVWLTLDASCGIAGRKGPETGDRFGVLTESGDLEYPLQIDGLQLATKADPRLSSGPSWRDVIPENPSGSPSLIDPYILKPIIDAADDIAGDAGAGAFPFIVHNGSGACLITWAQLPMTFAVAMPYGADPAPLPAWARTARSDTP